MWFGNNFPFDDCDDDLLETLVALLLVRYFVFDELCVDAA